MYIGKDSSGVFLNSGPGKLGVGLHSSATQNSIEVWDEGRDTNPAKAPGVINVFGQQGFVSLWSNRLDIADRAGKPIARFPP
jgi:hypothetical protein